MDSEKISIIIPAYNEKHFLPALLKSLKALANEPRIEIVIVDNGSTDGTAEAISSYPCRYIYTQKKVNPSTARNMGVRAATGKILVFLDADVVVTASWIETLKQKIPDLIQLPMTLTGDQYHISSSPSWIEKHWFDPLRAQVKDYINGGNIITTKTVFDTINGFDQALETGEDVDFCHRAVAAGTRLLIDPRFITLHEGFPKTIGRFIKRERWHGTGDFEYLNKILKSKVALLTIVFIALHLVGVSVITISTLGTTKAWPAFVCIGLILCICALSSQHRFKHESFGQKLAGALISYLYFFGRSLSFFNVITRKFRVFFKERHHQ